MRCKGIARRGRTSNSGLGTGSGSGERENVEEELIQGIVAGRVLGAPDGDELDCLRQEGRCPQLACCRA